MNRVWFQRALFALALLLVAGSVWAAQATTAENEEAVLERVQPRAEHGDANAQYNMGVIYDRGYGVERDYAKARHWYEKAAAQDYAKAAHNLGVMYQQGHGVAVNSKKAARWFKKAAELGEPAAANNLSVMYARGEGVPQDMDRAVTWAARAARAGNESAIANLPLIDAGLPKATINGDDVNIRPQPDTGTGVLKQASAGTEVVLLKHKNDWSQVLFPDDYTVGWVADFLLHKETATAANEQDNPVSADTPEATAHHTTEQAASTPGLDENQSQDQSGQTTAADRAAATDNAPQDDAISVASGAANAATSDDEDDMTGSNGGAASEEAAEAPDYRTIAGDVVNIREQPSTQSAVQFQAHRGDRVTVMKSRKDWVYIKFDDGRSGWVADYLLIDAD